MARQTPRRGLGIGGRKNRPSTRSLARPACEALEERCLFAFGLTTTSSSYTINTGGYNNIYMAFYSAGPEAPSPGEMRFITYTNHSVLTNAPAPSSTLGGNAVLVKYTLLGDANLDGTVNFNDFSILQTHYGQAGDWSAGDFNYDGSVNFKTAAVTKAGTLKPRSQKATVVSPAVTRQPTTIKQTKPPASSAFRIASEKKRN
jgi:hypothetical protein